MSRHVALLAVFCLSAAQPSHKTENIILVMTDGLRWQEVFQGPDTALMPAAALMNDKQPPEIAAGHREALLPFFWQVVAKNGQIYGNRTLASDAYVTNGFNFSYP